jgi:hypothetical protein
MAGEGKTFNTKFGCENMVCSPFSSELLDTGVSRDWKTKNTAASWLFAFTAHTLTATDWLVTLIDPHMVFT